MARVPWAAVVDALLGAQGGVRRGHPVERETTRVGLANPGVEERFVAESRSARRCFDMSAMAPAKNHDVPRATINKGFDRAFDGG